MTNPKSDTFHIKRFSDHLRDDLTVADVLAMDGSQATLEALKACVASHNARALVSSIPSSDAISEYFNR